MKEEIKKAIMQAYGIGDESDLLATDLVAIKQLAEVFEKKLKEVTQLNIEEHNKITSALAKEIAELKAMLDEK